MNAESVEGRIVKALAENSPLQSGELRKACGNPPASTFHKHCGKLLEDRRIVNKKKGRRVFYAISEDAWKLKSLVENRTALEDHVIRGARQILDELMTVDLSDPMVVNRAMFWRCGMLIQAVDRLRRARPDLPDIEEGGYEEYTDTDQPEKINLTGWYKYWLDVLESLKAL